MTGLVAAAPQRRKPTANRTRRPHATPEPPPPTWEQMPQRSRQPRRAKSRRTRYAAGGVEAITLPQPNPMWPAVGRAMESLGWRVWGGLTLVALLGLLVMWLTTAPRFMVQGDQIRVEGNQWLTTEEIIDSSELVGANLFTLPRLGVAHRLSGLTGVADAKVWVDLSGQVVVAITERTPWLLLHRGDERLWFSPEGLPAPEPAETVAVSLVDAESAALDQVGHLKRDLLAGLQDLQRLRPELRQLYYGSSEGLYFRAAEGWTVYLGDGRNLQAKLALLEGVQRELVDKPKPQSIDLRIDGRAVTKE